MSRLSTRDLSCVHAIEDALRVFIEGGPSALGAAMAPIRELLGVARTGIYSFREALDGAPLISIAYAAGAVRKSEASSLAAWLAPSAKSGIASVSPLAASASHQELRSSHRAASSKVKIELPTPDHMGARICDGSALVGWFGALQDGPFDQRQCRLMARLAPSIRRRVLFERQVARASMMQAALEVALEASSAPAFLVSVDGELVYSNAAGRSLVQQRGRLALGRGLLDATAKPRESAFHAVQVRASSTRVGHLVFARVEPTESVAVRCAQVATLWKLTPRQEVILDLVVRGLANRTIADDLGIAQRTVEIHVTAILCRAGVESRSALAASVLLNSS